MTVQEIIDLIDKATEPPMPRMKALEILEAIASELEGRMDALHEDARAEADANDG